VIRRIGTPALPPATTTGSGEFTARVRDKTIVSVKNQAKAVNGVWNGSIEVCRGEEDEVSVLVRNSSSADVVIHGELIDGK